MTKIALFFNIILIVAGLFVGMTQGALFFSDYGAGESFLTRLWLSLGIAVSVGAVFGYFLRSYWWLAVVSVWMLILFTSVWFFHLITGRAPSETILHTFALLLPVVVVLSSSYLGARLQKRGRGKWVLLVILIGILGIAASILFVNIS